jgi:hypothetical protein
MLTREGSASYEIFVNYVHRLLGEMRRQWLKIAGLPICFYCGFIRNRPVGGELLI